MFRELVCWISEINNDFLIIFLNCYQDINDKLYFKIFKMPWNFVCWELIDCWFNFPTFCLWLSVGRLYVFYSFIYFFRLSNWYIVVFILISCVPSYLCVHSLCMHACLVTQSYPALYNHLDCSPSGSSAAISHVSPWNFSRQKE